MKTTISRTFLALLAGLTMAASAHAGGVTGIGGATLDDVKLGGITTVNYADQLAYSSYNPASGANGTTTGFASAFGGGTWSLIGKEEGTKLTDKSLTDNLSFSWTTAANNTTGTWSITNSSTKNVTLDLSLGIHASNASTAFLFDDQQILAGQKLNGTWSVEWLKSGNIPGFSNAALFYRDARYSSAAPPVPEPETYAMLLAGLGMIGFVARRRKNNKQ